jgi:hypothetical protein
MNLSPTTAAKASSAWLNATTLRRLERAAKRCQKVSKATYGMLKRILQHKLDQVEEQDKQLSLGLHENIRGADQYQ